MALIFLLAAGFLLASGQGIEDSSLTCANVKCTSTSRCFMVESEGKLGPRCLDLSCETTCTKCPRANQCVLLGKPCDKEPCCPIPTCRPRAIAAWPVRTKREIWCTTQRCPEGYTCSPKSRICNRAK
ncbi:hypothetical protein B9Z55_021800 [Caenorhabditis nigoni]|uniref:Uncharacterized protein n=2 Tax=Caenorhabditis nigoni TaxID=1611254 RepID=A0A2G5TTN1_9PELO|nr:hypothetical protein B9Z55_021800 [Caenorhabditis nigoni]